MSFKLFVRPGCPYSTKAKRELTKHGKKYISVSCKDVDDLKSKLKEHKLRIPKVLTFPRVYNGSRLIGGCDDLVKHLRK
ncbi:glutaredoxin [Paramecium bursaria Chlorella virus KS1B]|nr:glutaredoxin [Paramecium bursaria Chlorella virus KS1B]